MKNENLNETVSTDTGLKELVVNYIGERLARSEEITVDMAVEVFAAEFPEFLLAVAEENFLRGYEQALTDVSVMKLKMVNREYHIHHIPVFVSVRQSHKLISQLLRANRRNATKMCSAKCRCCYISDNPVLDGRNAAYSGGAIYMKLDEPTNEDMIENFVHEVAHAVELEDPHFIYDDRLIAEFAGKRSRLYHLLTAQGFDEMPQRRYDYLEYNKAFDDFLANVVGYPTLLNITMGLFCSPYAATSIQEYFANGFEKYFTEGPRYVKNISPVLYQKVVAILNDDK